MGSEIFIAGRCVVCRTNSLPSSNYGFRFKLTDVTLIYILMLYLVERMTSSVLPFLYFTQEPTQIKYFKIS